MFDLFQLFVNEIAGSIFLSMWLIILIMLITGILGRMAMSSIIQICLTFMCVFMIGYVGALAAIPLFIASAWYMISGILNWYNNIR